MDTVGSPTGLGRAPSPTCLDQTAVVATQACVVDDGEDPLLPGGTPSMVDQKRETSACAMTTGLDSQKTTQAPMQQDTENGSVKESDKGNVEAKDLTPPSDEELLKRLEEANRMLEADEKSRSVLNALSSTTPGHSRKGSGSSIVSSTSSNSFYSTQNSAENEENYSYTRFEREQLARARGEQQKFSPHHRPHHQQKQPKQKQHHPRHNSSVTTSALRPHTLSQQRSSSLDNRKSSRSLSDPRTKTDDHSFTNTEEGLHLLHPAPFKIRRVGSSQNVGSEKPAKSVRKGSSGSIGRRGSHAIERPISPSLSDLLFGKALNPPPYVATLWDALNIDLTSNCEGFHGSQNETLWEIWGRIINDFDAVRKRPAFLKELVRKGIPHEFRGMAWQLVLGVHDSPWKQEYREHMKKTSPCEKLIRRDIARTFPEHDFFREKDGFGQESLFNVMKAYSLHDREVGYCQGSGFIVGLLLMQMPEEDAFAVLVRLMQDFRLRELFKPSMAELGLCMYKLECLIQELLPTLLVHFQTQNFDTSMYASSWFLTLFVTSLPLSLARRIMDLFVSEGMEMIFRVGVAILQMCQEDLLALDMEGLLKYLQKDLRSRFEQDSDQDNLLQTAYGIKYNHKKMKKLEKEYTALKTKENEDQIELRRLRTENRLLRQRIENLEKVEARLLRQNEESSILADKLVQDQVTWAQEVEQTYSLRNELSVTRQQMAEMQKKLVDAEDIIGDIRKRTRLIKETVHLDEAEEENMVKHLQEELIAVRLREAETSGTIQNLKQKISELEDSNLRLQRAPSNDVQQLQEELIAVKLREAEANLSLKELRMKVNEIESYWEAHMERVRQNSPKEKSGKAEVRHLQEEVMGLKLKEARAVSDLKDAKQKLMELETQNQICSNQIRRMGDENKGLKEQLEEAATKERDLQTNIKDLAHKLDDTESKRREEAMMSRIRDAECTQQLAELRHRVADIDIQREELLAAGRLTDKGGNQDLENKLYDLQDEVLQLQMSVSPTPGTPRHTVPLDKGAGIQTSSKTPAHANKPHNIMTYSFMGDNSDEEVDAEIKDSENLNQTLTDIIEGRSPQHQTNAQNTNNSNPNCDMENLFSHGMRSVGTDHEDTRDERSEDSLDVISDIETNPLYDPDASSGECSLSLAAGDSSPSVKSVYSSFSHRAIGETSSHSRATSDSGFSCSDDSFVVKDLHPSTNSTSGVEDNPWKPTVIKGLFGEGKNGSSSASADANEDGKFNRCTQHGLSSHPVSSLSSESYFPHPGVQGAAQASTSSGDIFQHSSLSSASPANPSISSGTPLSPNASLTEWDLYEEIVVVDKDKHTQVVHSGFPAQKSHCLRQRSPPSFPKQGTQGDPFAKPTGGSAGQVGTSISQVDGRGQQYPGSRSAAEDLEAEDVEWSDWHSEIPDVEIIYEPSSSSLKGHDGDCEEFEQSLNNGRELSLKESTV